MNNIEKIRQEIERRKKEHMYNEMPITIGRYYEDRDLLAFIDFDLQEKPEEDLEKEMYNKATSECDIIWNEMGFQLCYDNLIEAFVAGAEWAMKREEGKK
jgi:hypothetical protein